MANQRLPIASASSGDVPLLLRGVSARAGRFTLGPVELTLRAGELCCVLGRAGAGKSLLLRVVLGLAPHTGERAVVDRREVGFVLQQNALLDELSAIDNVSFAARARGLDAPEARARETLDRLGLEGAHRALPASLSGGMRRRVALARALVGRERLLVLDEPTAGLDPSTGAEVRDVILGALRDRGAAALIVTQDVDLFVPFADRVLILDEGRPAVEGAPSALLASDASAPFAPRQRLGAAP